MPTEGDTLLNCSMEEIDDTPSNIVSITPAFSDTKSEFPSFVPDGSRSTEVAGSSHQYEVVLQ